MSDVGVGAVVVQAIDASAIAGGGEDAVLSPDQRIDDIVVSRPDSARRLGAMRDFVDLGTFGDQGIAAEGLYGARLHNRNGRCYCRLSRNRQRRQIVAPLFADSG